MIPEKMRMPERNRTVHTGLSATTVSMNGIDGLFHCQPCQNPPSQSEVNMPSPPMRNSQKLQLAAASECSVVLKIRGIT